MSRALAVSLMVGSSTLGLSVAVAPEAMAEPHLTYAIGKCFDPSLPVPQQPTEFDYNCDGTGVMKDMTWSSWGPDGARGTGSDASIECKPNCAQGTLLTNPIVVHAWNPAPSDAPACPADVAFYSDLTIAYPDGVPPWIQPDTTWDEGTDFVTVDGMPAVHYSGLKPNCAPR